MNIFKTKCKLEVSVVMTLGDDAKYSIAGVGAIPFPLKSGNSLDFDDFLFVLGLWKNLLSVPVMEDKGLAVEFENQQVLIILKV